MRVFTRLVIFLLISASILPFLSKNSFAATFNPTFSGSLTTVTLSANPNVTLTVSQPAGDDFLDKVVFKIPAGFDINSGANIPDGTVIGTGSVSLVVNGQSITTPFTFDNLIATSGHKAHWLFNLPSPYCCLDIFVDGSVATGHTFTIDPLLSGLSTPLNFSVTISGIVGTTPVVTNPTIGGEYNLSADFVLPDTTLVTKNFVANYPVPTSSGNNVTDTFNGGISITINKVVGTGGETTITSSTTAPAAGTGEFQLGGLYYDFDTTANIKCPCTITIPYDPLVTLNPKIYHLESGVWVDRTTSVDTTNYTVTGVVSSFSFFAVGQPLFNVSWDNPISEKLEKKGNPFNIENDEDLGIKFNLLDSDEAIATPTGVSVEIWQTKDSLGLDITSVKVLALTPSLQEKKDRYQTELDLKATPLSLGTYEIRVLVDNTTATQTPSVAAFTVVED